MNKRISEKKNYFSIKSTSKKSVKTDNFGTGSILLKTSLQLQIELNHLS